MSAQPDDPVATFRWLCQALSPLVGEDSLRAALPRSDADWNYVVHVASSQLVLPSLYRALRDKKLLAAIPPALAEALEGFHTINALHNARLRQQMLDVTKLLNGIGVAPVWLKGATHLLVPDWRNATRMMLDLDFWVPDAVRHPAVLACLEQAGYLVPDEYTEKDYDASHHFAPRMREGEPARIEIHRHLVSSETGALLDDREALPGVEWFEWEGRQIGRLAAQDRLMHSYIQCTEMSFETMEQGRIPLMKSLDFVERVVALGGAVPADRVALLDRLPWRANARRFFSFLEREFGLPSPLQPDDRYLRRMKWAIAYPRATYGLYILEHAFNVIRSGRAGSPRDWWPKLSRHLEQLRQRPSEG